MQLSEFDYDLPEELIAQTPLEVRDEARLLVYNRKNDTITHTKFRNIVDYIMPEDCLVLNNTRVLPARLIGSKKGSGGKVEFVLLKNLGKDEWEVLVNPGRRIQPGHVIEFSDGLLEADVLEHTAGGNRIVKFRYDGIWQEVLDKVGTMPLPPYIHAELKDRERYQTVYSKIEGSAAAPTAGLNFTTELLERIKSKGTAVAYTTLHIGLGTFRTVKTEIIEQHEMHSEYYHMDSATADIINERKRNGGRIISVGTTSCRVLETVTDDNGIVHAGEGNTSIFIYPGYKFKAVDALVTNFHLPKSTLLMLVSAFAGRENVLKFYNEAIKDRYRFFSFGDTSFII